MDSAEHGKETASSERLVNLFEDGISTIPVKKQDQQLETRALSKEEQDIIQQRVAHQQKLLEEYKNREQNRKIAELQNVCEDLTKEEAILALQKCNNNEDEAAVQLTSDDSFLKELRQSQKKLASESSSLTGKFTSRVKPSTRQKGSSNSEGLMTPGRNLQPERCPEQLIPDLQWGTKSSRTTNHRLPIQSTKLTALKGRFGLDFNSSARSGSRRSSRLQGKIQDLTKTSDLVEAEDDSSGEEYCLRPSRWTGTAASGDRAISRSGYTCRGRVKQKAQKRVELIQVGELNLLNGWFNAGYIFPLGFKSRTSFRSSRKLNAMCEHECEITRGKFWPQPTFVVTASDRPHEPLISKSCTGSWSLVLNRINSEITRRRRAGEDIPPPPKTAIAGPEYFGLVQEDSVLKIESLDPDRICGLYWAGKKEREIALKNLPLSGSRSRMTLRKQKRSKGARVERWSLEDSDEDDGEPGEEEEEEEGSGTECKINKWSSIDRSERYKRRCLKKGTSPNDPEAESNPLPTLIDPVTLETVVAPAISPYGHVMGIATWRAYLMNSNVCPFTKQPLTIEQCTRITKHNLHKYKDRILHV